MPDPVTLDRTRRAAFDPPSGALASGEVAHVDGETPAAGDGAQPGRDGTRGRRAWGQMDGAHAAPGGRARAVPARLAGGAGADR